ncbi:MAG: bifunctional proline dehydrogenase/L-glutamate gamma-semialdehyde dehydrogenase PutA [Pseudomonadota bacterium]
MKLANQTQVETHVRKNLNAYYRMDETAAVNRLLPEAKVSLAERDSIEKIATKLVTKVRKERLNKSGIDSFLYQYDLSTTEGITLMCIAEALLRIPDKATIDKLLRDKIPQGNWKSHRGQSHSLFVNATTWGLMFTGRVLSIDELATVNFKQVFKKLIKKTGEPLIRQAVKQAMKILGKQFVMGQTIENAIKRADAYEAKGYGYSYDMLGEAARTAEAAKRYYESYLHAINKVGSNSKKQKELWQRPGISVKLSALFPRYEFTQYEHAVQHIVPLLRNLAIAAKENNICLTVDAEEADRLDLSLEIIEQVFTDTALDGWEGFGLAIQAYQKRCYYLIDWLHELAKNQGKRVMIRLVKGAYWDSEIKWSQELSLNDYPVFTRKVNTDISYLACVKKMLHYSDTIYPAFATHNAHAVATIIHETNKRSELEFEFQCLHGMGQALYDQILGKKRPNYRVRIYAPVGQHEDLLPYLVRRLLENGANTSFVNRIVNEKINIKQLVQDPVEFVKRYQKKTHAKIPKPQDILITRKNSPGIDLSNDDIFNDLLGGLKKQQQQKWLAKPTFPSKDKLLEQIIYNPADKNEAVGQVTDASEDCLRLALENACAVANNWDNTPVQERAACLQKTADLFEQHFAEFIWLAVKEAGKTLTDAIAEVREAIDFCRYYAEIALVQLSEPQYFVGPTGETNLLTYHGRGPILCISPWNFPLAIFTGQVVAALVTGNAVLAKPAEQTPLIAALAVRLMHQAGIPKKVLQLIPGSGEQTGRILVTDKRVKGVVFTGSTATANIINQTLAKRENEIVPLIAETGGQNAMIVDSSALLEQVVVDVITSAFRSAGQRCSALRVLYIQEAMADNFIAMLKGAMAELRIGNPFKLDTDIGPVIDSQAQQALQKHIAKLTKQGKKIFATPVDKHLDSGNFVAPIAFLLEDIAELNQEVFGPVLHVIRYRANELNQVIEAINGTGYGLTLGIHSRIGETIEYIQQRVHVGNCYVNRNMIGAMVGVQPFGGEGLSGTGPKAGGPNYLKRLVHERTLTINTTASGGNASLLMLQDEYDEN